MKHGLSGILRIGVIGVGGFGIKYVDSLQRLLGVKVTWICDLNAARCKEVAQQYGIENHSTDFQEVCNAPNLDAVVVVTPENTHRDSTIAALEAGKHVIVEKPLATTDEDAAAMIDTWKRSDKLLMTAHLLRFDYRYAQLQQRLTEIAPVRNIYANRNFDRHLFHDFISRTHTFIENSIHDIDLLLWYVGCDVKKVHGFCRKTSPELPNPDINWGILEFDNGVLAVIQSSWMYPEQNLNNIQWNSGIQVMGDRGVLEVAFDQCGFRVNTEKSGLALIDQTAWANINGEPRGAFGAMLRHFVACILGQVEYRGTSPQEAYESVRIAQRLIKDSQSPKRAT